MFENIVKKLQEIWSKSNQNQKLLVFGIAGGFLFCIILISYFSTSKTKVLLYESLSPSDYSEISKKLDVSNYKWSGIGTHSIYVLTNERQKILTELAQDNLLPVGVEGYEIFDMSRWDETTFEKNIKLHRAIKGSLEKMLMTLDFIKKARVELAIPKQNYFLSEDEPAKASVVLELEPGIEKPLKKQVMGIKNLIYRAVPKLKRENITITDTEGNEFLEADELDREERLLKLVERKKNIEEKERKRWLKEISERLHDFYPEDRISIIRVSLDMNWDEVTETQNIVSPVEASPENPETPYSERKLMPNGTLVVSENKKNERFRGNGLVPSGVAGIESQLPPGYRDEDFQKSEYGNNETIVNHAFNTSKKEIKHQPWEDRGRSIAVAVDGTWKRDAVMKNKLGQWVHEREYIPPSAEELQTLKDLLKASLLYKAERGDQIEVKHLQKDRMKEFLKEDKLIQNKKMIQNSLSIGFFALLGLALLFFMAQFIRLEIKRRKVARTRKDEIQQELMSEAARKVMMESDGVYGTQVDISLEQKMQKEVFETATRLVKENPEKVARLIRTWIDN